MSAVFSAFVGFMLLIGYKMVLDGIGVLLLATRLAVCSGYYLLKDSKRTQELTLTYRGLSYSHWNRPLSFEDVKSIRFETNTTKEFLYFDLKKMQRSYSISFWGSGKILVLVLPLKFDMATSLATAQLIHSYYHRQIKPKE